MSRAWAYRLYAAMAALAAGQYLLQHAGVHIPLVHAYLDDLLCMPLLLFPVLWLFRRFMGAFYVFPAAYPILTWVALCVVFEGLVPLQNPRFTADGLDMLCYGLGGVLFWYMQVPFGNQEPRTKNRDGEEYKTAVP